MFGAQEKVESDMKSKVKYFCWEKLRIRFDKT